MPVCHETKIPLKQQEINSLLQQFQSDNEYGTIGKGDVSQDELHKIRKSKVLLINELNFGLIHEKIESFAFDLADKIFCEDNLFNLLLQITEYDSSYQGFYDWHTDASDVKDEDFESNRVLSFSILLNNSSDFDGGNFEFENLKLKNFENTADMVMFYSDLKHRVTPVLKGTRYSLVGWLSGMRKNNA